MRRGHGLPAARGNPETCHAAPVGITAGADRVRRGSGPGSELRGRRCGFGVWHRYKNRAGNWALSFLFCWPASGLGQPRRHGDPFVGLEALTVPHLRRRRLRASPFPYPLTQDG
jgi:hypothetical protein